MKNKLIWLDHLFWMIGMIYLNLFQLKFNSAIDCYYWALIHLSFDSKLMSYERPPLFQFLKGCLVSFFGFAFTIILLIATCFLLHFIFK